MRTGGVNTGRNSLRSAILPLTILLCLAAHNAWGDALVGASYNLNWDQKVDKKEGIETETWTLKQTLDVKYRGFLQPIIANEITLKVDQESKSGEESTLRINPVLTLGYKGTYWAAGAKRNVEETNEVGRNPKITDSYFVELFVRPLRPTLPDLKAKYNLDKDYEKDATDTSKNALTASTVYTPMGWIQFKGDYSLNQTYDYRKADSDTQDSKIAGVVAIRHMFSPKIKFDSEYKSEDARGFTKVDAGGRTNDKKDTDQTWKNLISYRPFGDTTLDASYDWDLKENKVTGEDTTTQNLKVAMTQTIGVIALKGDFTRAITEPQNTADDNRKTEDTWTADAALKFSKLFTFTAKYQDKSSKEVHFDDPSKNTTSGSKILNGAWVGELTPFWRASASFDHTDTYTKGVKTAVDWKYSLKSSFVFKPISLLIDPTYDVAFREDLQASPSTEQTTKDIRVRIGWVGFYFYNWNFKIDHTYGRKTDSLLNNIQRTDDTSANVTWRAPLPGMNVSFDLTRSATDTSGDALPTDVTSSVGFKADFRASQLAFAVNYKYDIKTSSDNSETLDAKVGWLAPHWDVSLTYNFTKTFSEVLNEGYTVSLAFKYILW